MKPQQDSPPHAVDWYVISDDGRSALRITHGLQVGESDTGALVLNDPDPRHCWLEFEFADGLTPLVRLVRDDHVMLLDDGRRAEPYLLSYGITLQLPNNDLYVGPDIGAARRPGPVLRIEPAEARPAVQMTPALPKTPAQTVFVPEVQQAPDWDRLIGDIRQPEPARRGADRLFVPGGRKPPGSPPAAPLAPSAAERAIAPAVKPIADPPLSPLVVPKVHKRRARARGPRGRRVGLATLVMIGIGVAAAAYRYPAGLDLGDLLARLDTAVAHVVRLGGGSAADRTAPTARGEAAVPGAAGDGLAVSAEISAVSVPPVAADTEVARSTNAESSGGFADTAPADEVVEAAAAAPDAARQGAADGQAAHPIAANASAGAAVAVIEGGEPARARAASAPAADDWRLTRARVLLAQGNITYPPEGNAVSFALDLLAEQPAHQGALAILGEATNQLLTAAMQSYERGLDYQARNTLEEIFGFNPENRRARQLWREWVGTER